MEFISVEEFLRQPKEVQEVFWEWWNPSVGDLFNVNMIVVPQDIYNGIPHDIYENFLLAVDNRANDSNFIKFGIDGKVTPLFTEGQLRKFIEDKTNGKVMVEYTVCENIVLKLATKSKVTGGLEFKRKYSFPKSEINLLQAYWKVAYEVAKESVENE